MNARADAASGYPPRMTVLHAGDGIQRWERWTTARFLVQRLLSGSVDGELSTMHAWLKPGVISHGHSHPPGQVLHGLDGVGRAQREGGDIFEVRAGTPCGSRPANATGMAPRRIVPSPTSVSRPSAAASPPTGSSRSSPRPKPRAIPSRA